MIVNGFYSRNYRIQVTIAGLDGTQPFKCAQGTKIVPDAAFEDAKTGSYDVVILPGGKPGNTTLADVSSCKIMRGIFSFLNDHVMMFIHQNSKAQTSLF